MKIKKSILFLCTWFFIFSGSVFAEGEQKYLIPGGQTIGVTLETDGVLISAIGEVKSLDGTVKTPALDAGLKGGDIIKSFGKKNLSSVDELSEILNISDGKKTEITYQRNQKLHTSYITPAKSKENLKYCIGAWVKDAASGIGTLTYIDAENKTFGALGHGIQNPDTGNLIPLETGKILESKIVAVEKGEKGIPGELKGIFTENKNILGIVTENKPFGLFGKLNEDVDTLKALPIGKKEDVKKGKAQIFSCISEEGTKAYDIEIIRISDGNNPENKDMIIKITDETLKEKTGGIVQGMSGSPIIQNGKLVGAVTHVFVNDPTKGYGIFIENMYKNNE